MKNTNESPRSLTDPSDSDGDNRWNHDRGSFGHMSKEIRQTHDEDIPILKIPLSSNNQVLIPAGIRDNTGSSSSEIPYWMRAIGKIFLILVFCVKAWYYTEMMVKHIKHGNPLSPALLMGHKSTRKTNDDVDINLIMIFTSYVFESVVLYSVTLQITLQGWMPLKWHGILGTISAGSSILVGWLGIMYCILDQTLSLIEKISFSVYWFIMIVAAVLVIVTGYASKHTSKNIEISHPAWAMRMYALSIGNFIYKMLCMLCLSQRQSEFSGLELTIVILFYMPALLVVELILVGIRKYRKN